MVTPQMSVAERQAFLASPRVAVIAISEEGHGPLAVPVWFYYEPGGDVCVWTGRKTHKAELLAAASRISICIQEPKPPYKYVSIEGTFEIEPVQFERDVKPLAYRYFGEQRGEAYLKAIGGEAGVADDILVRIHPKRWLSVDYSKLGPLE